VVEQWRYVGSAIESVRHRCEVFNIMLSMPSGRDAQVVQKAVREFAKTEFSGHRYVMVLREHQANLHVHLSVRAESMFGVRLNPRKADLHRWRKTFAEKLRGWGIDAESTRQATRGRASGLVRRLAAAVQVSRPSDRFRRDRFFIVSRFGSPLHFRSSRPPVVKWTAAVCRNGECRAVTALAGCELELPAPTRHSRIQLAYRKAVVGKTRWTDSVEYGTVMCIDQR